MADYVTRRAWRRGRVPLNMTGRDVHTRLDALESKIDSLRTAITWGLAALGLLIVALRLFG